MGDKALRKVLLTTDTVGGIWHYAVQLSKRLASQHRMEVALATMGTPLSTAQRRQLTGAAGVTLHESSFRLEWMSDPWDDVAQAGDWLLALEARLTPDIVHLNQYAFGSLPLRAPKFLVAHSCVVSWWRGVRGGEPPVEWDHYREVVQRGLRGADLVGAPTRDMLMSLAANYGYRQPGVVLPNGRDPDAYLPAAKRPVILSAGRLWDEAKNLQALEEVAAGLPWPIMVAGSNHGPEGGLRASRGVRRLGELPADELSRHYASASIYAHPARYEPFGLAPLEAALAGCALVLGDLPSLREIWGDAACYVAPDDHAALQRALLQLIDHPTRLAAQARKARAVALRHSGASMATAYLAAYRAAADAAVGRSMKAILEEQRCAS
jgi:glycogen(starch) synthase